MFREESDFNPDELEKILSKSWSLNDFSLWKTTFPVFSPPPRMSVSQWAERYRIISPEFANQPGRWRTSRVPYMCEVMDACSPSDPCRRVVLLKCSQSGGTEAAILNLLGFAIHLNPRSILLCLPNIETASAFARERLEPMLSQVPELRAVVADTLPGPDAARRSAIRRKLFPGGILNIVGANSVSGLSSRPIPICLMDEVDACVQNSGRGGSPIALLTARAQTFPDGKLVFISSPSNEPDESGIFQLWNDSSQGWLETSCPGCGHWQVLSFEAFDLESARVRCSKCHEYFTQAQWNGRGEPSIRWRHDNPHHPSTKGFRLSAFNSPWVDWKSDLGSEYLECKRLAGMGDDSLLKTFTNTKLARPYKALGKRPDTDLYSTRREPYSCHKSGAEVPDDVLLLTAGVDVHDQALFYEVVGWGKGMESWGILTGSFSGDPRNPQSGVWEKLDHWSSTGSSDIRTNR